MTNKSVRIRVSESLCGSLEKIRREVAEDMKKRYNLDEITIHGTVASEILAAKENGQKNFPFKIRKTGLKRGILELG